MTKNAWLQVASLAQLGTNIMLTFVGGPGAAMIASAVEASLAPLLNSLLGKASVTSDIQAGYGAIIGSMEALKSHAGINPADLQKVEEYLVAAMAANTAFALVNAGFNANLFVVDGPLTPAVP
jgi:hypothetical protein